MAYKLGDTIWHDFTTHNPSTGGISNTDSTPICAIFEDNDDTAILSSNAILRDGKVGIYRVSSLLSTENGYNVGKNYNIIVTAIMNSVVSKAVITSFILEGKRIDDLNDISSNSIWEYGTRTLTDDTGAVDYISSQIRQISSQVRGISSQSEGIQTYGDLYWRSSNISNLALKTQVDDLESEVDYVSSQSTLQHRDINWISSQVDNIFPSAAIIVHGNKYWISGTGTSADLVWGYVTRTLTAGTKDNQIEEILDNTEYLSSNAFPSGDIIKHGDDNWGAVGGISASDVWAYTTRDLTRDSESIKCISSQTLLTQSHLVNISSQLRDGVQTNIDWTKLNKVPRAM